MIDNNKYSLLIWMENVKMEKSFIVNNWIYWIMWGWIGGGEVFFILVGMIWLNVWYIVKECFVWYDW